MQWPLGRKSKPKKGSHRPSDVLTARNRSLRRLISKESLRPGEEDVHHVNSETKQEHSFSFAALMRH